MIGDPSACDRQISVMRWGRNGDVLNDDVVVMSWRRNGDGIVPCGEHIWRFYVKPHNLWLPNEIMDKEAINFVLLAYYWLENIAHRSKHRHSFADAPHIENIAVTCLGHFELMCTSPNVRRLLCAVRRDIGDGSWRADIRRKFRQCMHWIFSRCPDALFKHGNYSCASPLIRRSTIAWWLYPNVCIARLEKPRGTVA